MRGLQHVWGRPALLSAGVMAGVLLVGLALDWYIMPERRTLLASDLFAGAVAGALAYVALRFQRARQQMVQSRLRVIAEMNHHIRNAITPLALNAQLAQNPQAIQMTREAVERIDWALREILPLGVETEVPTYEPKGNWRKAG
jgi:hypothetical protein